MPKTQLVNIWPAIRREDGVRIEVICPHGIGHAVKELSGPRWQDWMEVHGCDGCCDTDEFKSMVVHHQRTKRFQ